MKAEWVSFLFFGLAGILHLGFFILESVLFPRKGGHKLFKVSEANHAVVKIWAINQGFYNLFLALGTFVGLYFVLVGKILLAATLISYCGFSMIGAGLVLWFTAPQLRRGALIQALPPLLGFFFLYFHIAIFF